MKKNLIQKSQNPLMKNLLLALMLLTSTETFAQKMHFTDSSNSWHYYFDGMEQCPAFVTYSFGPDTIIAGNTYRQMVRGGMIDYSSSLWFPGCGVSGGSTRFLREDTASGIIYQRNPTDTGDIVFFNYNKSVGDTFFSCATYIDAPHTDSIFKIDTILMDSVSYRVYHLKNINYGLCFTFIEGIGNPFYWGGEKEEKLRCFDGSRRFSEFSTKVYFMGGGTYQNNTISDCGPLAIVNAPLPVEDINISPNPVTDIVNITSNKFIKELTVTNLLGETIAHYFPASGKISFPATQFASGIYVLTITSDNAQKYFRKFVKQ